MSEHQIAERTVVEAAARSIGAAFLSAAARSPAAPALLTLGLTVSYGALRERALAVAHALRAKGIEPGDPVAMLLDDSDVAIALLLGTTLSGAVPVLFHPDFEPQRIEQLARDLDVRAVFVSPAHHALATFLLGARGAEGPVLSAGREAVASLVLPGTDEIAAIEETVLRTTPDTPWAMVFSSGVTSPPKLCCLSHRNLMCKTAPFAKRFGLNSRSRIWLAVPTFLTGFLKPLVSALEVGASILVADRATPSELLDFLEEAKVTHAYPIYRRLWLPLVSQMNFQPSRLASLQHLCLLGDLSDLRRIQRALPHAVVMNTYGAAEVGGAFCLPDSDDPAQVRLGSAGRPFPGHEVRICDPSTGAICAAESFGEIQVRGEGVADADHRSSQNRSADGWLRTEDFGFVDRQGNLHYLGRLSELLSLDGQNVPASTIEMVLNAHPAVVASQVVEVIDEGHGDVVRAFVELRAGEAFEPSDIIAFCKARLTPSQVPRYLSVVDVWPLSASKISKRDLADLPLGPRLLP